MAYDHLEIEARWQRYWDEHGTFRAARRSGRPKRYILDMFPYPSGVGLHVAHPKGYTATDIVARAWRMRGYDVLHPMGWDAFGLPAEQHAIETGQHPARTTADNIATFKRQLKMLGLSYDWSREIDTTAPGYVRWTQWILLQLFRRRGLPPAPRGGAGRRHPSAAPPDHQEGQHRHRRDGLQYGHLGPHGLREPPRPPLRDAARGGAGARPARLAVCPARRPRSCGAISATRRRSRTSPGRRGTRPSRSTT
jgi:hypothetical protein